MAMSVIASTIGLFLAAQPGDQPGLPGRYTKEGTSIYLVLGASFYFILHTPGEHRPRTGNYTIDGDTLTLTESPTGQSMLYTVQDDKLYDQDGSAWIKQGTASSAPAPQLQGTDNFAPSESNAFAAAYAERDLPTRAAKLENFLQTYPQSANKGAALNILTTTYRGLNNDQGALSAAKRGLQVNPNDENAIFVAVQLEIASCNQTGDAQTCNDAAELGQRGLSISKPSVYTDDNWRKTTAITYPFYRTAISLARAVAPPPPAQPQYGDIAPPPPPPAPAPTISLGETKAEVTAAFGEPARKAVLGPKEIFVYKDMKVTFTNGKVSNVE